MNIDLAGFLVWIMSGGALIASQWIFGQIPWYVKQPETLKQWLLFGLAVLFGVGAYAVNAYVPAETLAKLAPYFLIISGAFVAIFINKAYVTIKNLAVKMDMLRVNVENLRYSLAGLSREAKSEPYKKLVSDGEARPDGKPLKAKKK